MRVAGLMLAVILVASCGGGVERSPLDKMLLRLTTQPADYGLCTELRALKAGDIPGEWNDNQRRLISDVAANRLALDC